MFVGEHIWHPVRVEVRGQLAAVSSFLGPRGQIQMARPDNKCLYLLSYLSQGLFLFLLFGNDYIFEARSLCAVQTPPQSLNSSDALPQAPNFWDHRCVGDIVFRCVTFVSAAFV